LFGKSFFGFARSATSYNPTTVTDNGNDLFIWRHQPAPAAGNRYEETVYAIPARVLASPCDILCITASSKIIRLAQLNNLTVLLFIASFDAIRRTLTICAL